jgi:anti-sigma regulatory factor (Ser/Thr protein kinase)
MTPPWRDGGTSQAGTGRAVAPEPPPATPASPSHHGHLLARWPLRDSMEFGALPGAVPCARAHTRQVLWEWGHQLAGLADAAELVVSELITNAVAASRGMPDVPPVCLWLASDRARVVILVGDRSPRSLRINPGVDPDSGRGLLLVDAVSDRWGWHPATTDGPAKIDWAELGTAQDEGSS